MEEGEVGRREGGVKGMTQMKMDERVFRQTKREREGRK